MDGVVDSSNHDVTQKSYINSSCTTVIDDGAGLQEQPASQPASQPPSGRSDIRAMVQSGTVLNKPVSYSNIGWKWARSNDAKALVEEWIDNSTNVNNGKGYIGD